MKKIIICLTTNLALTAVATADTTQNLLAREENHIMKNAKTLDQLNAGLEGVQNLKALYASCQWQLRQKKIPYDCYDYNQAVRHFPNPNLQKTQIRNLAESCVLWAVEAKENDIRASLSVDSRCSSAVQQRMKIVSYKKGVLVGPQIE